MAVLLTLAMPHGLPDANPAWASVVAYDEVRVDVDTTRLAGTGPSTAWLRWTFLDRASSPEAWDRGVRTSIDLVEVDCERAAARTFSSLAYDAERAAVLSASFEEPAAAWRAARPETMAAHVVGGVCGLMRRHR